MYPQYMFGAKIRKISKMKIFIFYIFRNHCILHGQVFVMILVPFNIYAYSFSGSTDYETSKHWHFLVKCLLRK